MSQNQSQGGLVSENRTTDNPPTIPIFSHGETSRREAGFRSLSWVQPCSFHFTHPSPCLASISSPNILPLLLAQWHWLEAWNFVSQSWTFLIFLHRMQQNVFIILLIFFFRQSICHGWERDTFASRCQSLNSNRLKPYRWGELQVWEHSYPLVLLMLKIQQGKPRRAPSILSPWWRTSTLCRPFFTSN